jgi:hypothetical protein
MRRPAFWCPTLGLAASLAVGARAAELTALPPPSGEGAERGVAVVRCADESGTHRVSRGAVLDVDAGRGGDVLLTTAHGLPRDEVVALRDCRVVVRGKAYSIRAFRRASGAGPGDDWAVLLTRRLPSDVQRLRAREATPELLEALAVRGASIRVVLRYAGVAQSDCRLEQRALAPWPLVPHSCLGYAGMSGSPLVVGVGGEAVVIGLHVGSMLEFDGTKLDFVSVGRALDAELAAAIHAVAARARTTRRQRE